MQNLMVATANILIIELRTSLKVNFMLGSLKNYILDVFCLSVIVNG